MTLIVVGDIGGVLLDGELMSETMWILVQISIFSSLR